MNPIVPSNDIIMKKIFSLLFLLAVGASAYAQKSYLFLSAYHQYNVMPEITLSGDVPQGMPKTYNTNSYSVYLGDVINAIGQKGYTVELMTRDADVTQIIFSKPASGQEASAVERVFDNSGEEVREVARYNLQGIPVRKNEKGVQIIVFSNYTTKTVVVE